MADENKELMLQSENNKSGNYKDAFAKFVQVALKNTDFEGNDIEFNSTLFGIKSEFDEKLLIDTNFVKEKFSRNLQLNLKINLNNAFDYDGISAGITYAVINKRDKQIVNLVNTTYGKAYEPMRQIISEVQASLALSNPADIDLIEKATDDLLNSVAYDRGSNIYYDIIIEKFKQKSQLAGIESNDMSAYIKNLEEKEKEIFKAIDSKPLWTISASGTALKDNKHRADFSTIFLKGDEKAKYEIDVRAKLTLTDTLAPSAMAGVRLLDTDATLTRSSFNFKAGVNFKLIKDAASRSLFEIKAYGEYNSILKNKLPNEKKDTFLANADFRIRLAEDLWLPITVKYDTGNANLLGFLNVTYNFE